MKKIFLFALGLLASLSCMSQQPAATGAVIRNWDGGDLEMPQSGGAGILRMVVGETKKVNYILEPADADPNSVFVEIENGSKMPTLAIPTQGCVFCIGNGVGTIYIMSLTGEPLAQVNVWGDYVGWQFIYPTDDTDPDYKEKGQIAASYDINNKFYFWPETVGNVEREPNTKYIIPDYDLVSSAHNYTFLWQYYRDQVTGFDLNYIDSIGANAFSNCTNLRYQLIPENVTHLGAGVFMGCTNLRVLEFRSVTPPTIDPSALIVDVDLREQVPVIIVPKGAKDAYDLQPWNRSTLIEADGEIGDIQWILSESDSLAQGLKLSVDNTGATPGVIPDRKDMAGQTYPWDALGRQVGELRINDGIRSIGEGAFEKLTGIEAIQFNQRDNPIESIHWNAFSPEIAPWKFAFGDPDDGPRVPPTITGVTDENRQDAWFTWEHFMWNTVLYVPDVTFTHNGKEVRSIDLYREDAFWSLFNQITDRTVDVVVASDSIRLSWFPLENAAGYQITIHKVNCTGNCDTSIVIPATGIQGLIDWANINADIPQYLAAPQRRAPKGDDGSGGMTLTISIKTGSGEEHNETAEVSVSGLKEKEDYTYKREVLLANGNINDALTKNGDFRGPEKAPTAIESITDNPLSITTIYDLLGRPLGSSLETLPAGLYIIDNGAQRYTILRR